MQLVTFLAVFLVMAHASPEVAITKKRVPSLRELSREVSGLRSLKASDDAYLHGKGLDVFAANKHKNCFKWRIQDLNGKVALSPPCTTNNTVLFLRANNDSSVELVASLSDSEKWTPFRTEDGRRWSFESVHSTWLRAQHDGLVDLQPQRQMEPYYWTGAWTVNEEQAADSDGNTTLQSSIVDADMSDEDRDDSMRNRSDVDAKQLQLSKEVAGLWKLKSAGNKFLTAEKNDGRITGYIFMATWSTKCLEWQIEDHEGKVALRLQCAPGKYLRSHHRKFVDIANHRYEHELWTPYKNEDGSWSFQDVNGAWLRYHMLVLLTSRTQEDHFWLEQGTATTTMVPSTSSAVIKRRPSTIAPTTPSTPIVVQLAVSIERFTISYLDVIALLICAALLIMALIVFVDRRHSIARKRKQELSLSYRNLLHEDQQRW